MDEEINIGVVGMGKMGILHAGILSSLDDVKVKAVADKQDRILSLIRGALTSISANTEISFQVRYRSRGEYT